MKTIRLLALAAVACAALPLVAQTQLRFAGATTLDKVIKPIATEVGAAHQAAITTAANGTGRGLEELVAGKAHVAMFAGDLDYFAEMLNAKTPGQIDVAKLKVFPLFTLRSVLIAHPSNPVAQVSNPQIRDIFSGKITNWKEVGGPDLPIVVVLPGATDGIRAIFAKQVVNGSFVANARQLQTANDVIKVVAQIPGAVSFVSEKNAGTELKVIAPADTISVPFSLITLGEPGEPLKSVITDLQARLK